MIAGDDGYARRFSGGLGRDLRTHLADDRGLWADESEAGVDAGLGKICILRQEAIARVDSVRAGGLGGRDQGFAVEVAGGRLGGANVYRLVCKADMWRVAVHIGINGDGIQAFVMAGPD